MRAHSFLTGTRTDVTDTDTLLTRLLDGAASWLNSDGRYEVRLGLHELLVNIRAHAYEFGLGPIDVGMTATSSGLTITVTDWGRRLGDIEPTALPHLSEGGYGLGIIYRCFDDVVYERGNGHNLWTLRLHRREQVTSCDSTQS
jgi:anti-sigma regulatory factor (Ser/Thr protein kinase)